MSRINRLPKGLQELVGNTAQGVNPSELSATVGGVLDMQPFWNVDRLETKNATAVVATPGQGLVITVPQGEMWQMVAMSARVTGFAAADVVRMGLYVVAPGNLQQAVSASDTYVATSVNERMVDTFWWPQTFFLPSGWQLWFLTDEIQIAAASETLTGTWSYYKILV